MPADTVADVFFLHPTTYFWRFGRWNAPMRLRRLHRYTVYSNIQVQASIFAGVGRLYAPHYRQATLYAFFDKKNLASQPAIDLAYTDAKAAFQYYLAHYNHGRPFILAGHSQGGYHATRLLHELVDNNPQLRKQLVAAYLVGCQAQPDEYQHLPALRDSLQTGGIIAWNTALRGTNYAPYQGLLATNPLTWTLDTANAPATLNRGGVPLNFKRVDPHLTAAQIHQGILWADDPHLSGYRRLHIPGLKELSVSFHIVDYNLFYLNVRENARARVRAWQSTFR
jgi:pimeloyl-ACP methyl ester carboxylesterase